ncbi:MAG TPA: prolyl oligopeptidase family serine peptidase [Cyclobacteriaceae bacterium]|nr:prolyl oligopeptidase family serine peptidase [Cyclobacteriaceae bacterium]
MTRPFLLLLLAVISVGALAQPLTLDAIKNYPFPTELTAAQQGSRIAWALDELGRRNIYVAEGPDFKPRKLTNYAEDDGQEISSLAISSNGQWVVFVRGGDHGSNWDPELAVNPAFSTTPSKVKVMVIPFAGGEVKSVSEGDAPAISPKNDVVAFVKGGQVWTAPLDGSTEPRNLFTARGSQHSLTWSPDGSRLAFVSARGDHSFIGIYSTAEQPIAWMAPSFTHDDSPVWSPDGKQIAFVRVPGSGGAPDSLLARRHQPWSIWTVSVSGGKANRIWQAPRTLEGSYPTTHGTTNLHWAAADRIVFLSYHDKWPHLYSMPAAGGTPLLLTPGNFMAEHIRLSPDGKWLTFDANTGPDPLDIDRRHMVRVPVDKPAMEVLTPGTGLEWTGVVTGDGTTLAMISATPQRPPVTAVMNFNTKGMMRLMGADRIVAGYPEKKLVTPKQVIFTSSDGVVVHGQLFEPSAPASGKRPAIIYIHGGPPRQMLLGWHYSDYYSNAYASNQYLASLGFTVLSVNYRLGIGYGFDFHRPANAGVWGASEYLDIKAAGQWLANQPNIDATKIGVYGGSYGGFLTAMALAMDSKLFAAGVDIHGVHDWTAERIRGLLYPDRFEKAPDLMKALAIGWDSSPASHVATWTSPVLIIHADDDRNVRFNQSTDLVQRLEKKGVPMETLVIVDDTHHWFRQSNSVTVYKATAEYFSRKLLGKPLPE